MDFKYYLHFPSVLCAYTQNIGDALRSAQEEMKVETCLWLNCVVSFLYDEWRDSMDVKK